MERDEFFRMNEQQRTVLAISVVVCTWPDDLNVTWTNDSEVQQLIVDFQNGPTTYTL